MSHVTLPNFGEKIQYDDNSLVVPDQPLIPYIIGDGIGVDITPVMISVVNAAVEVAYNRKKKNCLV